MTALSAALDIPDDEPRAWRGLATATAAAVVWLAVGVVLARTFALGGTTHANLVVGGLLAVPGMVLAWLLAGPHRQRTLLAALAMVAGVVLIPLASYGATPSPARLSHIVDAIRLPGTTTRQVATGDGRCRSACSQLERTVVATGESFIKVRAQVIGILKARLFTVQVAGNAVRAQRPHLLITVDLRQTGIDRTRYVMQVFAQGPAPKHSVG